MSSLTTKFKNASFPVSTIMSKPLVIIIRDGWGFRESSEHNALAEAGTPRTDELMAKYPHCLLQASGEAVGVPPGFMGNSEVGHMTIGSGRIIPQSLLRIDKAIRDGSFFENEEFLGVIRHCKEQGTSLHLLGLLQKEGVHSHLRHLFALLDLCAREGLRDVKIHVITDGRDAPVRLSRTYIQELLDKLDSMGFGEVVSVSGRYYAMDRDKRWDRTEKAYDAIIRGIGVNTFRDVLSQVRSCHESEETDEFIKPRVKEGYNGVKPHDGMVFFNFRTDRPRQFTQAVVEDDFDGFEREKVPVHYVAMTKYYRPMAAGIAFGDVDVEHTFGELLAERGLRQLRISETEKYAHVTFFFNAEREEPYDGEERVIIPSPKVTTYDLQPEMSAYHITDRLVEELDRDAHDVVVTNIVNGDMVGHTGVHDACIKAVRVVDECVGRICDKVLEKGGAALVLADHGNIEDQTEEWNTSHTKNPVPFILVSKELEGVSLRDGGLRDVTPTALDVLGLDKPDEMSGSSLIRR